MARGSFLHSDLPLVSVIVLNWNGKHLLNDCLSSLMSQTYPNYEVILVDNGSTDGSIEYVRKKFPTVKIVGNPRNLGFSKGNNIGFRHAMGKYCLVLNNDTHAQRNLIEELAKVAESDESVASVGCKILQLDGTIKYGPVFMFRGFVHGFTSPKSAETFVTNLANCACIALYRRSVIEEIGGFDPYFWANWEDHDLGYRMNLVGFKSVYTPNTSVLHVGAATHGGVPPKRAAQIIRNMLYFYLKNYETQNLIRLFPELLLILFIKWITLPYINELSMIVKRVFKKERRLLIFDVTRPEWRSWYGAFLMGFLIFLQGLRPILVERQKVQKMRVVRDKDIFRSTEEKNIDIPTLWLRIGY